MGPRLAQKNPAKDHILETSTSLHPLLPSPALRRAFVLDWARLLDIFSEHPDPLNSGFPCPRGCRSDANPGVEFPLELPDSRPTSSPPRHLPTHIPLLIEVVLKRVGRILPLAFYRSGKANR